MENKELLEQFKEYLKTKYKMWTQEQLDKLNETRKQGELDGEKRERQRFASLGGKARNEKLSEERKSEIGKLGSKVRWQNKEIVDNFKKVLE